MISTRIRATVRQQWAGVIALVLVLTGGVAWANHEAILSSDIVNNEIRSEDIKSANVQNSDIGPDSVTSGKIRNNDVRSADVLDASLTGGDITNNSLTGGDVDESSLAEVPFATFGGLGKSSTTQDTCNPAGMGFASCATLDFTIPPPGARLLLIGEVRAFVEAGGTSGVGNCQLEVVGGGSLGGPQAAVQPDNSDVLTFAGVTSPQAPGSHSYGLACNQTSGTIDYNEASIVAVGLSPTIP
jgi:hypothetical protein